MTTPAWTINGTPIASAGISNLRLTFRSRAADTAEFDVAGDYDGNPAYAYNAEITIALGGDTKFRGRIATIPRQGSGTEEYIRYVAKGPWADLERAMYTQTFKAGASSLDSIETRCILGIGVAGSPARLAPVSYNDQIDDIIASAHSRGAHLTAGDIDVSARTMPADEQVDLTCAAALERCLSWFPDTVSWFDYSATPPTLHIKRCSDLDPESISALEAESISITPRNDLVVPGVRIIYEHTTSTDSDGYRTTSVDEDGNPDDLGAIVHTVQLDGGSMSTEWEKIESEALPASLTSDDAKAWWLEKIPELAGWSDITLHDPCTPYPPRAASGDTLDRELISGTIQPWMTEDHAEQHTLTVQADYTLGGVEYVNQTLSVTLTLTDASGLRNHQTGTYSQPVPANGLAAEIYAAHSVLHYEGSITYVQATPDFAISPGNKLNITDGRSEWAAMNAVVQSVQVSVDSGSTTIQFGPPQHLGVADLVQATLPNRKRAMVRSAKAITSASASSANAVSCPKGQVINSGHAGGTVSKMRISNGSDDPSVPVLEVTPNGLSLTKNGQTTVWPSGAAAFHAEVTGWNASAGTYAIKWLGGTAQCFGEDPVLIPAGSGTTTQNRFAYLLYDPEASPKWTPGTSTSGFPSASSGQLVIPLWHFTYAADGAGVLTQDFEGGVMVPRLRNAVDA